MESIRMLLTENCDASCANCINKSLRTNSEMDMFHFEKLCRYFSENGIRKIRIMGGEPTIHSSFIDMVGVAQNHFDFVTLFSNAISGNILGYRPRQNDGVNYNFRFSKLLTQDKLLLDYPGRRSLQIVISKFTDITNLIKEIDRIVVFSPDRITLFFSLDCSANIFIDRTVIVPKFETVIKHSLAKKYKIEIDHAIPICFVVGTQIPIRPQGAFCGVDCAGLVDSNYKLRYCNQYHNQSIDLFQGEELIHFSKVDNFLSLQYYNHQIKNLNKICIDCPLYMKHCNGGCYMANESITKKDVILNTQLPVK